jgi:hypothetical protein
LSGTEVRRCGQAFVLGRYCTHFHMANRQENSYLMDNSIHHSFQRATTVHGRDPLSHCVVCEGCWMMFARGLCLSGTHLTTVKNNVAFHVRGHTFFVEDGGEMYNTFENNLAALTFCSEGPLAGDAKAANFWTSSPLNIWRHNVAAGSCAFGYWFELPSRPGGAMASMGGFCSNSEALGEFFNNTAHTSGGIGVRVYPHWTPLTNPCSSGSPSSPQYLYNTTSFRNGGNGIFHRNVGDLHWVYPHLIDNGGDAFFWKKYETVGFKNESHVQHALIVGSTNPSASVSTAAMHSPQNEFWFGGPMTIVNYGGSGAIRGCADVSVCRSSWRFVRCVS